MMCMTSLSKSSPIIQNNNDNKDFIHSHILKAMQNDFSSVIFNRVMLFSFCKQNVEVF